MHTSLLFKTGLILSIEIFLIYAAVYTYIIGCIRSRDLRWGKDLEFTVNKNITFIRLILFSFRKWK